MSGDYDCWVPCGTEDFWDFWGIEVTVGEEVDLGVVIAMIVKEGGRWVVGIRGRRVWNRLNLFGRWYCIIGS